MNPRGGSADGCSVRPWKPKTCPIILIEDKRP